MSPPELVLRAVGPDTWSDLESPFEARGGPHYCWCMLFRGGKAERVDKATRKAAMRGRVWSGVPIGLLGYRDERPVGWVSLGPRSTFRRLGGPPDERDVWSITCFFVPRALRGQGLSAALLRGAVDHARGQGAQVVEAYPVAPESPTYGYMGRVPAFEAAGFVEVGRAGKRRHVMRLVVS